MDVLLVEDDDAIAAPLTDGLGRHGFAVRRVRTGGAALDALPADLVLLDLGLPDVDGLDLCRRLRERSGVPIIVVSARGEELDRVLGLELGADDYVVKPFALRELVARMRAVLRRQGVPDQEAQRAGPITLDRRTRRVQVDGEEVGLTPKEFDLLALLMDMPGVVVPRRRMHAVVWGGAWFGSRTLDQHVATLRRKLGQPELIETVRGIGYRLRTPP